MPQFRPPRRSPLLYAALLGLVPTVALLTVLRQRALTTADAALHEKVLVATARVNRLLDDASATLGRLVADTAAEPTDATLKALNRIQYDDPRFREVGVLDPDGRLVMTNFGRLDPPLPVSPATRPDPNSRQLQVLGLIQTAIMREKSILLALPTVKNGSVNLLVDPIVLTYLTEDLGLGGDGYLAVTTADRRVLAAVGSPPLTGGMLDQNPNPARVRQIRASNHGDVLIVAEYGERWALRYWLTDVVWFTPFAVALYVGAFWLVRRFPVRGGMAEDLRVGLERGEFQVHYQPIVELATGRVAGAEALLRWTHPLYGAVRPDLFIPVAEQTGLIDRVTMWVADRAVRDLAPLRDAYPDFYVSINLPASALGSGAALALADRLRAGPFPANRILFELTERAIVEGTPESIRAVMDQLEDRGFRIALDDFGTGYSSLSYLHKFRFHALKIDKSFLPPDGFDSPVAKVLDSLIELGLKLGLTLIAEGVETQRQAAMLTRSGVRLGQGWLYAKAMPVEELTKFLDARRLIAADSVG